MVRSTFGFGQYMIQVQGLRGPDSALAEPTDHSVFRDDLVAHVLRNGPSRFETLSFGNEANNPDTTGVDLNELATDRIRQTNRHDRLWQIGEYRYRQDRIAVVNTGLADEVYAALQERVDAPALPGKYPPTRVRKKVDELVIRRAVGREEVGC